MPLYEFKCPDCGLKVSVIRKMSESSGFVLCECGCKMKRVFSAPVISGFGKWISSSRKKFEKKHGGDPEKAKHLVDL